MPLLKIQTNRTVADDKIGTLLRQASTTVAEMLGKPERYVMVSFESNPHMLFAGDDAPLAYLELKSIGLPGHNTAQYSATLAELLQQQLEIPADRIYVEFASAERHLWGWNGGTF